MEIQTTEELIKRISERYYKVRNEKLEYLWKDFLSAVEKAVRTLSDEELVGAEGITIYYYTEGKFVYRSNRSECLYLDSVRIEYEEKPVCLGETEKLVQVLQDFKKKAEEDDHIDASMFDVEDLLYDKGESCLLDFHFFM